jgi:N-acetylglucosaminyldiphosphoundecaprenol N-acetyl-beta-D-mannosaminyltransferase
LKDIEEMENTEVYQRKRDLYIFNSVGVCATTKEQFVEEVFRLPVQPISASVVLIGVPAVISSKENPEIARMYSKATIAAIDGMPIVKMARSRGLKCERCAAPDIMGPIFEKSVKQGKTHYFYGGKNDDVLIKLRKNLERDYPGVKIVGMHSPPFRALTEDEDIYVVNMINEAKPDFLWVGIGAPKQEIWITNHVAKIQNCVMLGVGAGFNFFAGTLNKAPEWMEKHSLEWLFRLIKEPKRLWKRYIIGGFKFLYYSVLHRLKGQDEKTIS